MAKYYGVNYTLAQPGPNRQPISGGDAGGDIREYYDEYTTTGAELIGDTIDFGPPSGALLQGDRVTGVTMNNDAFGVATTLAVGDDGSAARYIAATNVNAAAHTTMVAATGFGFQVDQDRPLRATIAGANCPAGKKVRMSWRVLRS